MLSVRGAHIAPLRGQNRLKEKLTKDSFMDKELKLLETGTSNAGLHELGSAKIYGWIGEAFAGFDCFGERQRAEMNPKKEFP